MSTSVCIKNPEVTLRRRVGGVFAFGLRWSLNTYNVMTFLLQAGPLRPKLTRLSNRETGQNEGEESRVEVTS